MASPLDVVKQSLLAFAAGAGTQGAAPSVAKAAQTKADVNAVPTVQYYDEDAALALAQRRGIVGYDPTAKGTPSGAKIDPLASGTTATGGMDFNNAGYAIDFSQGQLRADTDKFNRPVIVDGKTNTQVFIIGDPNNPNNYIKTDPTSAVNAIIAQHSGSLNGILGLKESLVKKRFLTGKAAKSSIAAKNLIDGDFWKAVYKAAATATFTNYNNGKLVGPSNFISFDSTLQAANTIAGTKTSRTLTLTRQDIAANEMMVAARTYLGRAATAKEVSDYVTQLKDMEKASPTVSKVTGDALGMETNRVETPGGVSAEQKQTLQIAIISKELQAKGVDPSAISKSGGQISKIMDTLKQSAADYGIQFDDKMALDAAVRSIQPGADYKSEIEKQKQIAKVKYKNLSSAIDSGISIKDVADQYQQYKNKILELAGPTNVFDPDIQTALNNEGKSGIMSVTDFTKLMRNKPEWANTVNAREEAANYATTILKQFGFLG